jgi:hypothetical protein
VRRVNSAPNSIWNFKIKDAARVRVRDLIEKERDRAKIHIAWIRQSEPEASSDRVARVLVQRFKKLASVEGGITGAAGVLGVPLNFVMFTYFQLAMVVAIAEVYGNSLEGEQGEDQLLRVIGRAHGLEDALRTTPRLLGALAMAIAPKYGLSTLGRLIPLLSAPIAARLNAKDIERTGTEALKQFGNVFQII